MARKVERVVYGQYTYVVVQTPHVLRVAVTRVFFRHARCVAAISALVTVAAVACKKICY